MTGWFWNLAWGYPTLNKIIGKGPPNHLKLKRARRALQVAEGHQPTAGARKLAGRRLANFSSFLIKVMVVIYACQTLFWPVTHCITYNENNHLVKTHCQILVIMLVHDVNKKIHQQNKKLPQTYWYTKIPHWKSFLEKF